jgi:hypothetical protein
MKHTSMRSVAGPISENRQFPALANTNAERDRTVPALVPPASAMTNLTMTALGESDTKNI